MIQDTINKIKITLEQANNLSDTKKNELNQLLARLNDEINEMNLQDDQQAQQLKGLTESLSQATNQMTDANNIDDMIENINQSLQEFETSHPRLVSIINSFCVTLSNMGI